MDDMELPSLPEKALIAFYLPLRRPMAISGKDGFIMFRDESLDWFSEIDWRNTDFSRAAEIFSEKQKNIVMIRLNHSLGKPTINVSPWDNAKDIAAFDLGIRPQDISIPLQLPEFTRDQPIRTVATCVTPLLGDNVIEALSTAFDVCLEELDHLETAYINTTHDISYRYTNRLSSYGFCYFAIFDLMEYLWSELYIFDINDSLVREWSIPKFIPKADIERVLFHRDQSKTRRPWSTFMRWNFLARQSLDVDGDLSTAVVQAHTASEVFMDTLLMAIGWEEVVYRKLEGINSNDVAKWFSYPSGLEKKVKTHLKDRVSGWNIGNVTSPIDNWLAKTVAIRNSVVHAGYLPTIEEAIQAIEAVDQLFAFIFDLLAHDENRGKYPRAAFIFLGTEGFKKRGKYSGKFKRLYESSLHLDWREEAAIFRDDVMKLVIW